MGIYGSIKRAIFGKDADAKEQADTNPPAARRPATAAPGHTGSVNRRPAATPAKAPPPTGTPTDHSIRVSQVDVENSLDSMPGADRLNWRTSIVDLMKLLGVESDFESRKLLAQELGRPDYSGDAEDNVWLHRKTMQELSRNGGKVPAEFLD